MPLCAGGAHWQRFAHWWTTVEALQPRAFPVSAKMARASRTVVGNTDRLQTFVGLLSSPVRERQCVNVIVFGGSVSAGMNIGGPGRAWPRMFEAWLNSAHPCQQAKGHTVVTQVLGGAGSNFALQNFDRVTRDLGSVDLFLIEFAINDGFIGRADFLGADGESSEFVISWYTEALIRCISASQTSASRSCHSPECGPQEMSPISRTEWGAGGSDVS